MNPDFSTTSCVSLLTNLNETSLQGNFLKADDKIYSSSFSGWIPLYNMFYKGNKPSSLSTLIVEGFQFQNLVREVNYYQNTTPFTTFNNNFSSHRLHYYKYSFLSSGENTVIYSLPGMVANNDKILFMICLSEKLCINIFRELADRVNRRNEVKIFMDYELMTPKYSKVYKLLESLYILPMLEKGIEMSIQPSESFMKEILGNELDIPVFDPEEIQEFERVLREEIL